MNSQLPYWISVLQALAVPAIGILAAVIGFFQWRTAHQKLAVDLFDRRWDTYTAIRKALNPVVREGSAKDEDYWNYVRASDRADFLFGDDVAQFLKGITEAMAWLSSFRESLADTSHPDRQKLIEAKYKHFKTVTDFYTKAPPIFSRYMRIDQKLPRV